MFVSVFSFGQYTRYGNYTYAAPYSHEATHGLLVSLALTSLLLSGMSRPRQGTDLLGGICLGLLCLLKAEFLGAGLVVVAVAFLLRRLAGESAASSGRALLTLALGALLPVGVTLLSLWPRSGFDTAWQITFRAPQSAVAVAQLLLWPSHSGNLAWAGLEARQIGLDSPLKHVAFTLSVVAGVVLVLGGCFVAARWVQTRWAPGASNRPGLDRFVPLPLALLGSYLSGWVPWLSVGPFLPGLTLGVWLVNVTDLIRRKDHSQEADRRLEARVLTGALALAVIGRMLLHGRVEGYGFVQGSLASVTIVAALIGEWPSRAMRNQTAQAGAAAFFTAFVAIGVVPWLRVSKGWFEQKTYAVGTGSDQFYTLPPSVDGLGLLVGSAVHFFSTVPDSETLMVVPEGLSINYLSRHAAPTSAVRWLPVDLLGQDERSRVRRLRERPPDWAVLLSRDLSDFGMERYGERVGQGAVLVQWLDSEYDVAAHLGGDALSIRSPGLVIYRRKREAAHP